MLIKLSDGDYQLLIMTSCRKRMKLYSFPGYFNKVDFVNSIRELYRREYLKWEINFSKHKYYREVYKWYRLYENHKLSEHTFLRSQKEEQRFCKIWLNQSFLSGSYMLPQKFKIEYH